MPKIKYVGPIDEVEIPSIGVTVQRGKTFAVASDEDVIALTDQVGNFLPHDKAAKDIVAVHAEAVAAAEAEALAAADADAKAREAELAAATGDQSDDDDINQED